MRADRNPGTGRATACAEHSIPERSIAQLSQLTGGGSLCARTVTFRTTDKPAK
ncbi:hypothetical protein OU5_0266 [Pseudomonas mandelii JR-1]|uniref:Uncharacterized protein n=1 Tax=Pseudomonas mandelii JR-1 TaxID=1147786 RepID=A0A024E459_9PSED|nr:hypothetical protein OU5_0266 [Pseudomonas mandelii JR-1]